MNENHAEKYADSMVETIGVMVADLTNENPEVAETGRENLDDWPLEIINRRGSDFAIVLTVGGPDARIICQLDEGGDRIGYAMLVVNWSDRAYRYGADIDAVADYFVEQYR